MIVVVGGIISVGSFMGSGLRKLSRQAQAQVRKFCYKSLRRKYSWILFFELFIVVDVFNVILQYACADFERKCAGTMFLGC
jgi:hypothetical protein